MTVRQPFASLIAVGAKTLLDQARPTGYRGRLLIRAAAQRLSRGAEVAGGRVMAVTGGGACWLRPGYRWGKQGDEAPLMLPLGVVVASCELVDVQPIVKGQMWRARLTAGELPLGRFGEGRHVWILDDVRPTTERCPRCWGEGCARPCADTMAFHGPSCVAEWCSCPTCSGDAKCPPVRMCGGPGLRTPEWEET